MDPAIQLAAGLLVIAAFLVVVAVWVFYSPPPSCAKCGQLIMGDREPPEGIELEDGRVVCGKCCAENYRRSHIDDWGDP